MSGPIELLFVDDDIAVVNKPSGLLVHRGWANDTDVAMTRVRDALGQRVDPVHRLDRGTSGALLFARTKQAASALGKAFEAGQADKQYLALVRGHPPEEGIIDHPIPRSEGGPRVDALTRYRLIARSKVARCSLVLAMPETGRLHQVRRHLRHLGHPLIGDVTYGNGAINREYRADYQLTRLALHAHRLAFEHPVRGGLVSVTAPMPDDLGCALTALGLPREVPA